MNDELHLIYRQLLDLSGSTNAIRDLVRDIQDRSQDAKSSINVSGTKEELIRNLKEALGRRFATISEVQQLLWDIEEVGRQHILLLTPAPPELATQVANIADSEEVAVALFDEMPVKNLFPRYEYPTKGYLWADFRVSQNGNWLAKAYGRETYRQSQGLVSTEEMDDGTIKEIRQYAFKEVKATLIAHWRASVKILELRIDIGGIPNEKAIDERRNELWTLLKAAFGQSDLIGVNVDKLLKEIIFERDKPENKQRYSISRVELTDPRSGQIRVIPNQSEELDKDPGRKASLAAMQENSFRPSLVRVDWKNGLDGCPECMTEPVSVVIEKTANGPELRILKRVTNATYEYIFNQLRSRL